MEKISKEFFETGISFKEYLDRMESEDDKKRTKRYYERVAKHFTSEQLKIDVQNHLYLVGIVATWCWDCKTNIPVLMHIAENSTNITLKLFIKENLQEDPSHKGLIAKINGSERIPQLLVFSKDLHYIDRWVERPIKGHQLYTEYKKHYGWDKGNFDTFLKEYRKAYLNQKKEIDQMVIEEVHRMLEKADALSEATSRYH